MLEGPDDGRRHPEEWKVHLLEQNSEDRCERHREDHSDAGRYRTGTLSSTVARWARIWRTPLDPDRQPVAGKTAAG
jgi:hypothetical protein